MITEYWAKRELLSELARLKSIDSNNYSMLLVDLGMARLGDEQVRLMDAIDRQFAYLEAGLVAQDYALKHIPAYKDYSNFDFMVFGA